MYLQEEPQRNTISVYYELRASQLIFLFFFNIQEQFSHLEMKVNFIKFNYYKQNLITLRLMSLNL